MANSGVGIGSVNIDENEESFLLWNIFSQLTHEPNLLKGKTIEVSPTQALSNSGPIEFNVFTQGM